MRDRETRATTANNAGVAFARDAKYADAIPHYLAAVDLDPGWYAPWLNLGIAYKHTHAWADSLRCSRRARELSPRDEDTKGALWNAGIAATALGDWATARWAWTAYGISMPAGEGPHDMALGPTPVRLLSKGGTEVVWCARLDPARARIESIPLPESGHRHGDIVLHDGEAKGHRIYNGAKKSVFNELVCLERSAYETWVLPIDAPDVAAVEELMTLLRGATRSVEDWTDSIEVLCKECSEGAPHAHQRPWKKSRRIAIATTHPLPLKDIFAWAAKPGRGLTPPTQVV